MLERRQNPLGFWFGGYEQSSETQGALRRPFFFVLMQCEEKGKINGVCTFVCAFKHAKPATLRAKRVLRGGLRWTRTSDPIDVNDVLYQLS